MNEKEKKEFIEPKLSRCEQRLDKVTMALGCYRPHRRRPHRRGPNGGGDGPMPVDVL